MYAERMKRPQPDEDEAAQPDCTPHVNLAFPLADDHLSIERHQGENGAVDAEHAQQFRTGFPFGTHNHQQEFAGDKTHAQHTGEGHEADETQHLAEHLSVAFALVAHFGQHGQCHSRNHAVDGVGAHVVPLAGVAVDAGCVVAVEFAQQKTECLAA